MLDASPCLALQVSKGPYIYEYGNHGGILVMADW